MRHDSRNVELDLATPRRDSHILVTACFLAIIACAGGALAVPAIVDSGSAPTTTQRSDEARAMAIAATGSDPTVPQARVVFRSSDTVAENQPPTFEQSDRTSGLVCAAGNPSVVGSIPTRPTTACRGMCRHAGRIAIARWGHCPSMACGSARPDFT